MRRLLLVLLALLALAAAPAAYAQEPTPTPTEEADDGILDDDEIPPESTPAPEAPCGDGADADYQYCNPCSADSPDADYNYCLENAGGAPPPTPKRAPAATQPLQAAQLPLTGGNPALVALFGAGLLLTGLGLRRAAPTRSG
jgi:hypothetical protein